MSSKRVTRCGAVTSANEEKGATPRGLILHYPPVDSEMKAIKCDHGNLKMNLNAKTRRTWN